MKEEQLIKETIEKIRPFIQSDGGDLEFIKYEKNKVYVKMLGACKGCPMAYLTLKEGIETAIKEVVPSVDEVVNVE